MVGVAGGEQRAACGTGAATFATRPRSPERPALLAFCESTFEHALDGDGAHVDAPFLDQCFHDASKRRISSVMTNVRVHLREHVRRCLSAMDDEREMLATMAVKRQRDALRRSLDRPSCEVLRGDDLPMHVAALIAGVWPAPMDKCPAYHAKTVRCLSLPRSPPGPCSASSPRPRPPSRTTSPATRRWRQRFTAEDEAALQAHLEAIRGDVTGYSPGEWPASPAPGREALRAHGPVDGVWPRDADGQRGRERAAAASWRGQGHAHLPPRRQAPRTDDPPASMPVGRPSA